MSKLTRVEVIDPNLDVSQQMIALIKLNIEDKCPFMNTKKKCEFGCWNCTISAAMIAVIELHKRDVRGNCDICTYMTGGGLVAYPCFTIQAIAKDLGE